MTKQQDTQEQDAQQAEQQAELDELRAQIAALEEELKSKAEALRVNQTQLTKLKGARAGWLLMATNPLFTGRVYGVEFHNGLAFIAEVDEIDFFKTEPMDELRLWRYLEGQYPNPPYTQADREREAAAIREREKMPSSKRAVDTLASDFGYEVRHFTADQHDELQTIFRAAAEYANRELAEMRRKTQSDLVVKPGYMGQGNGTIH